MKKTCKSALGLALVMALVFSLTLFAGAADNSLKVFVASDIHYRPYSELTPLKDIKSQIDDPLYFHANDKSMLTYEADAVIAAFLADVAASGAEYLLIPGDLSEEGHWAEHLGIAKILKDFQKRSGVKVFVIPGNHDIRTSASRGRLDLEDFTEVYADLGYNRALARREGDASYTAELGSGYRLLAIDGLIYREDESAVSPELFAWIEEQLAQAKKDGKKMIAMTHYNVLDHFLVEGFTGGLLTIDQYRKLATMLADGGVKYVFTGHVHANDITYADSAKGNRIFDVETGCLLAYPNAYRQVVFSDKDVKIETRYVTKINTALLPPGFSRAQLDLMKSDFPKYSYDYHRAAFRSYSNMLPDLTGTLADALGAEKGTVGYEIIDMMVRSLTLAVELPLYGEKNSVEAVAKKAGVKLEPSEYKNLLDIAGIIYGGHLAGNEPHPMESLEMKLLGQALNAVLVTAMVPDIAGLRGLAAKRIFARTPGKAFTNEFVRMLAAGILTDWGPPDDLNATLEPYGETWEMGGNAMKITDLTFALDVTARVFRMGFSMVLRMIGL